jgi:hypothetical protein
LQPTHTRTLSPVPCLQCYGFVTFASPADAENVLEFAKQQGIWADERMLRINWAQGSMPGWKVRLLFQRLELRFMCRHLSLHCRLALTLTLTPSLVIWVADLASSRVAVTRDAACCAALCLLLP